MTTYKAIGFDWGGVLNGKPGKFFGESVSGLLGISHEQYKLAYFHHNQKINRGEVTWEQLWGLVLTELGRPNEPELVQKIIAMSDAANADDLNIEMLALVDTLRSNGYKVGLLSNNVADKAALMREKGLDTHFDAFDISIETGLVKPEPAAFEHLADKLGVDISELIFIDDSSASLSTATETGFTPVLFDGYDTLIKELTTLGVDVDV